jgi:hypothetical protein
LSRILVPDLAASGHGAAHSTYDANREFFAVCVLTGRPSDCGRPRARGRLHGPSDDLPLQEQYTGDFVSQISFLPMSIAALFVLATGLLLGFIR